MSSATRFAIMHATTIIGLCVLSYLHADTHIIIAVASGWFGFMTGDRMRSPTRLIQCTDPPHYHVVDDENSGAIHLEPAKKG